jgi:hypothetical protein
MEMINKLCIMFMLLLVAIPVNSTINATSVDTLGNLTIYTTSPTVVLEGGHFYGGCHIYTKSDFESQLKAYIDYCDEVVTRDGIIGTEQYSWGYRAIIGSATRNREYNPDLRGFNNWLKERK